MIYHCQRKTSLDLARAIKGFTVMSQELESMFNSIYEGVIPVVWTRAYSSLKPFASWFRDLLARIEFFSEWAKG